MSYIYNNNEPQMSDIRSNIIDLISQHPLQSSSEIYDRLHQEIGYATVKRILQELISEKWIATTGKGKGTKYILSPSYELLHPVDVKAYFGKEQDERQIKSSFNQSLISEVLPEAQLFTETEQAHLHTLHTIFKEKIAGLTPTEYDKEMERLAIDLSWKSSQIEGNTYTLLETERLLKEKETAEGKPKDDATMLLNHKEAINFITDNPDYVVPLTIRGIEDIHSILVRDLGVDRNLRRRSVGITGTNYRPPDNEHQIREALLNSCTLINGRENILEKALLGLVLLSYIQAFADGNKRTACIVSNAILIAHGYCPLSFRTVDSIEYKKAMLIFYEQNNISAFKQIFVNQYKFAVDTYF